MIPPRQTKMSFSAATFFRGMLAVAGLWLGVTAACQGEDWPQWRGPTRDGVWNETGVVEKFADSKLAIRWRAPVASGYSGPTVADGRVFVTDRLVSPDQIERVHCFDEKTGEVIWMHDYPCTYVNVGYEAGPRAAVSVSSDRAYALGAMGNLKCLNVKDGEVIWEHDLNDKYKIRMPIWGISSSPLIDDDLVIVQIGGEGEACLVAFDKATGEERWKALPDDASYSAPIIIEQAGKRVLVCWTGNRVVGLDPKSGKLYWEHPFMPTRMVISIATPAFDGKRLFVSSFYDGSLMLNVNPDKLEVSEQWRRLGPDEQHTDSIHCMIGTPILRGEEIYGVDSYGELRCLQAASGDRIWEDLTATPKARWSTIHMVTNHDRVWMLNERGELLITELSPQGFKEISRAKLLEPTTEQLRQRGGVCWSHPAFANRHVFARNDKEIVCADLSAPSK